MSTFPSRGRRPPDHLWGSTILSQPQPLLSYTGSHTFTIVDIKCNLVIFLGRDLGASLIDMCQNSLHVKAVGLHNEVGTRYWYKLQIQSPKIIVFIQMPIQSQICIFIYTNIACLYLYLYKYKYKYMSSQLVVIMKRGMDIGRGEGGI